MKVVATVRGGAAVAAALRDVSDKVKRQILRDSIRRGVLPIIAEIRQRAPRETRTLEKSIGRKETNKPGKTYIVAGPRRRFERMVMVTKSGKKKIATKKFRKQAAATPGGAYEIRKPTKYAHLVELGHRIVRGGREIGRVDGSHFMRDSFRATQATSSRIVQTEFTRRLLAATRQARRN